MTNDGRKCTKETHPLAFSHRSLLHDHDLVHQTIRIHISYFRLVRVCKTVYFMMGRFIMMTSSKKLILGG